MEQDAFLFTRYDKLPERGVGNSITSEVTSNYSLYAEQKELSMPFTQPKFFF